MRLPNEILNTVCFIAKSSAKEKYRGTGFVVSVPGAHRNAHLYIVTARHVARAVTWEPFIVGFNTKKGTKGRFELNYDSDVPLKWWYHPSEPNAVDVAAIPFSPSEYPLLEVEWIHYPDMFATPEVIASEGIGIADEISVVGLFTAFSGKDRHYPIVRTGNLAMLPTERIPVEEFDPMEAYLAEGRSIGGLSGSPVFVRKTVNISVRDSSGQEWPLAGTGKIYFLGLVHGHWDAPKSLEAIIQSEVVNMGVSIVVPAHKVWEVLNQPELSEKRKRDDEWFAQQRTEKKEP
jgi:hypothetical protein